MGNSLQDQLVKAGLADARQARKAKSGKSPKRGKKKDRGEPALSDSAQSARQAMAEKANRDRELNRRRKQAQERKATMAQIRQLIEQNRIPRDDAEDGYHFTDGAKIRKLFVTPAIREQLSQGRLDIVRLDGRYDVVPSAVAEKIRLRDAGCVVARPVDEPGSAPSQDDPYADYPVPDDLMW
ncbi:MAG: DUF2058 domain-containing protein [Gammaproteobacteria bacterium]